MVIKESTLKEIIKQTLLEALSERGTNMQTLYHFTYINALYQILKDGFLKTSAGQKDRRNGKRFISFTRHRSRSEGFERARECNVRIEVDGQKLSSLGGDIYPFEYYSPKGRWSTVHDDADRSAKKKYQDAHAAGAHLRGEGQYMHQAEESFETTAEILPLEGLVTRIDILLPWMDGENVLAEVIGEKYITTNSPLLNNIYIYSDKRDFNLQDSNCVDFKTFYNHYIQTHKRTQVAENKK